MVYHVCAALIICSYEMCMGFQERLHNYSCEIDHGYRMFAVRSHVFKEGIATCMYCCVCLALIGCLYDVYGGTWFKHILFRRKGWGAGYNATNALLCMGVFVILELMNKLTLSSI